MAGRPLPSYTDAMSEATTRPGCLALLEEVNRLHGVCQAAVAQPQQMRQLLLVQFPHAGLHVLRRHEFQEGLLPAGQGSRLNVGSHQAAQDTTASLRGEVEPPGAVYGV